MVSPLFKPIKQEKLSIKISNQIKFLIMEGELKPGDPLPPERELMTLLGVSRPSLREALKSLVGMGFLETTKGNRTIVKSLASGRFLDPLHHLLMDDIRIAFDLIEVRKAIEAWNAYYAACRATETDILRLEDNMVAMQAKIRMGLSLEAEDADFHLAVSQATHNKIQTHIMFTIYDVLKNSIGKYYDKIDPNTILEHHRKVVDAIRRKDADLAREGILEHLNYVESRIKEMMDEGPGKEDSTRIPEVGAKRNAREREGK
jgi:GntR family transcriptional regulator, transcriptional repressor for pyruvate dehydrogenase complex